MKRKPNKINAIMYSRFGSAAQLDDGKTAVAYMRSALVPEKRSIDKQRQEIRRFAFKTHVSITHEFVDLAIAADDHPEFSHMICMIKSKKITPSYILIYDYSRLSRMFLTMYSLAELLDKMKITVISTQEGILDLRRI